MSQDNTSFFAAVYSDLRCPEGATREQAWAAFWKNYEPKIRAWAAAMKLNAGHIDDVTGRVTLKLIKAMPSFEYDSAKSFSAWLRRVVQNEVHDFWNSVLRHPGAVGGGGSDLREALEQHPDQDAATDSLVEGLDTSLSEQEGRVRLAMARVEARVEPHTWRGFVLTTFENLTAREAAEQTGQSIAAIHVAKNRIRKMLQKELDEFHVA